MGRRRCAVQAAGAQQERRDKDDIGRHLVPPVAVADDAQQYLGERSLDERACEDPPGADGEWDQQGGTQRDVVGRRVIRAGQAVMLKAASTLVGRNRTTISPGTPLCLPNSSARSGPI